MDKKSVFILQEQKGLNELKLLFNDSEKYEVCGCATDGINALPEIKDKRPNVLITDIVLSGYDGLKVIERVKEINSGICIIVLSAFCTEEVINRAMLKGAYYFMAKPFDFALLQERIDDYFLNKEKVSTKSSVKGLSESLDEKISKIFINVGIPPHIKGYSFLREGVKMAVNEPQIINNITKQLYPMIGQKYQTTASKVERAIRHAIEVAWNRGRIESINAILGVRAYVGAEKPTNGEFIALIADKMLLERA